MKRVLAIDEVEEKLAVGALLVKLSDSILVLEDFKEELLVSKLLEELDSALLRVLVLDNLEEDMVSGTLVVKLLNMEKLITVLVSEDFKEALLEGALLDKVGVEAVTKLSPEDFNKELVSSISLVEVFLLVKLAVLVILELLLMTLTVGELINEVLLVTTMLDDTEDTDNVERYHFHRCRCYF